MSASISGASLRRLVLLHVACVTTLLYKNRMARNPIQISEARKNLSRLVERVANGGGPIAIGKYGEERALLVSPVEYRRLKNANGRTPRRRTLEGLFELTCTPEELMEESRRLGDLWVASLERTEQQLLSPRRARRK
jgi:prevent-host-death family protein